MAESRENVRFHCASPSEFIAYEALIQDRQRAKSGDTKITTGPVQLAVEDSPDGKFLHIRVPLKVSLYSENLRIMALARQGFTVELEGGW